jgi:hypothetical protein
MRGRYIAFLARYPSRLAPDTAIAAAMLRAIERARRNPRHPMHEQSRAPAGASARAFNPVEN